MAAIMYRKRSCQTILKGNHRQTIPARFGLIEFSSFEEVDLNVKVYAAWKTTYEQTPSDDQSSHGVWSSALA